MANYENIRLADGFDLYVNPTEKFKTTLVQVFVERPLDAKTTAFALLPNVLERGSQQYPDSRELALRWDDLYGAMFNLGLHKFGERHVFELQLELANDDYLPAAMPLFSEGMATLGGLLKSPALEGGRLRSDYIEQEKDVLRRRIESRYNDKATYALYRAIQEMCVGEPFARSHIGDIEELTPLTPDSLYSFYQEVLREAHCRVVVTGRVNSQEVANICHDALAWGSTPFQAEPEQARDTAYRAGEPRQVREEQEITQGKLVLGMRSDITYTDKAFPALLMYNGILGGFPHSKLFLNVRERASLAYYCSSRLISAKGLLFVESGIACEQYERAVEIIRAQITAIQQGEITAEELEKTRLGLFNLVRGQEDDPAAVGRSYMERVSAGADFTNAALLQEIAQVRRDDVVAVAEGVSLDTLYFLHGPAGGGGSNS